MPQRKHLSAPGHPTPELLGFGPTVVYKFSE
jgi:hypothetical protein